MKSKLKIKEKLQNYSIVDLKIFIDAMNVAFHGAREQGNEDLRESIICCMMAAEELLLTKIENFINDIR